MLISSRLYKNEDVSTFKLSKSTQSFLFNHEYKTIGPLFKTIERIV
jgi:hypothetical protein